MYKMRVFKQEDEVTRVGFLQTLFKLLITLFKLWRVNTNMSPTNVIGEEVSRETLGPVAE